MKIINWDNKIFLRDIIGSYIVSIGEKRDDIVIVNADLSGTCRNKSFVKLFPERSFNVGIAEQNMVSFAAGLAHEGFKPYVFSMAPFICMRACEQCRTDVAYANLDVCLIGIYAGVSGGISGATHWGIEDCAIMGSMPNMKVVEPCDPIQAMRMLDKACSCGPIYMRCSIEPMISIYDETYKYDLGKASIVKDGKDGAFICSGVTVKFALRAALDIENITGKTIKVIDMHTIKPIDEEAVVNAALTGNVIVAQDHNIVGGLGYYVAAVLAEKRLTPRFANLGIKDQFCSMAHAAYFYEKFGYDVSGLTKKMLEFIVK